VAFWLHGFGDDAPLMPHPLKNNQPVALLALDTASKKQFAPLLAVFL